MCSWRHHLRRQMVRHPARPDRHRLQLVAVRPRLDVHAVLCAARHLGGFVGWLAGTRRSPQGGSGVDAVLVRRHAHLGFWRSYPPVMGDVAGLWGDRRNRTGPRLHFAGVDAHQVVPRSARYGHRYGDHGLWWRRDDRLAAGNLTDEALRHAHRPGCLADLCRAGASLQRVHALRRLGLPRAAHGLEAGGLDGPSERCGQRDDRHATRTPQERPQDAAILAAVAHPLHERVGGYWHHRRGCAHAAGDLWRFAYRPTRSWLRRHQGGQSADRRSRSSGRGFCGTDLAAQHLRPHRLGFVVGQAWPQTDVLHLLRVGRGPVCDGLGGGGKQVAGAAGRLVLHHRVHVRRRFCDHTGLPGRHVRHAVCWRYPRPPAHGVVDGGHRWSGGGELHARRPQRGRHPLRPDLLADLLHLGGNAGGRLHRQSAGATGGRQVVHVGCRAG